LVLLTLVAPVFRKVLQVWLAMHQYLKEMWILLVIGLGMLIGFTLNFLKERRSGASLSSLLREEVRYYLFFFLGLLMIAVFRQTGMQAFYLDFVVFLFSVYYLVKLTGFYARNRQRPAWAHPTTAGGIVQGTISLGIIFALWEYREPDLHRLLYIYLMIVLVFEALTLWARFSFLSKAGPITRLTLKMLLGSHLALFGIRFIFGLMMPLVYLIWLQFISTTLPYHPLLLMIFIGELSERILFFITSPAAAAPPPDHTGEAYENQRS